MNCKAKFQDHQRFRHARVAILAGILASVAFELSVDLYAAIVPCYLVAVGLRHYTAKPVLLPGEEGLSGARLLDSGKDQTTGDNTK